jgi:putative transposase
VTDVMGNLLAVKVHAANVHDTVAGGAIASEALFQYPSLRGFCADAGYRGTFANGVPARFGKHVDISERIKPKWEIIPKRWVVERTFAWAGHSRRLSKDYEITTRSAETIFIISHLHTLLKRF